jgi:salicylate hydroxylase
LARTAAGCTVHRADLHRLLADHLDAGTVRLGRRCTGVEVSGGRAVLRFPEGEPIPAGLVVAADGIHSVVRTALVEDRPRFSGQLVYRGLVPAPAVPFLRSDPRVLIWLGPDRHFVAYPVRAGELVSFAATAPGAGWQGESWQAPGEVPELRAAYRGWCAEVSTVLAAAEAVHRWALHDRDVTDRWGAGPVTLLGDAAHPMLPFLAQGANQAIEDAAALAVCLRQDAGAGALRRYERLRQSRTADVHRMSRANATLLHRPDDGAADSQDLRRKQWLFGYDAEAAAGAAAA